MTGPNHRKRVKHLNFAGQAHELTFSCYRRFPLLEDNRIKLIVSKAIDRAIEAKGFELVAYVIMPEHIHLIVFPIQDDGDISALLSHIKRPSSY